MRDEAHRSSETTVWVLTDSRYMTQLMPRALIDWLSQRVTTRVVVADELVMGAPGVKGQGALAGLAPGDALISRTRHPLGLTMLREAERSGAAVAIRSWAVDAVRDKARAAQILAEAGVPAPQTYFAAKPGHLKALGTHALPLVLKPYQGDNGRGLVLIRSLPELDRLNWTDEMVIAQQFVDGGGCELKLYVADGRVWAVRGPTLFGNERPIPRRQVEVTPSLRDLAFKCGRAFGLELYGVDVVVTPKGPFVLDVNEFPNYRGVPEAPEVIGRWVTRAIVRNGI